MERGFYFLVNQSSTIDLHLNCWRCFKNENEVFLDVGIMLTANSSFKTFAVFFPFFFTRSHIYNLYKPTIDSLDTIFNDELGTETKAGAPYYTYVKKGESQIWGIYDLMHDDKLEVSQFETGTLLTFSPDPDTLEIINSNNCYFRIRISTTVKDLGSIITLNKTQDYFLKSSREYKEIVSFRINNMRDITKNVKTYIKNNKLMLMDIDTVRLFFITNFEFDIKTMPDQSDFSTRVLEIEFWKKYLSDKEVVDPSYCYYWKVTNKKEHYSFLFNTQKNKCNIKTILIYIIGLLLINCISSCIIALFRLLFGC